MNVLVGLLPLTVFVALMVIGPLRAAFRLIDQKDDELAKKDRELALERAKAHDEAQRYERELAALRAPRAGKLLILEQADRGEPAPGGELHYRITVRNASQSLSIEQCRATLQWSDRPIAGLPLPLHWSQEVERSHTITLNPREERKFDVFRMSGDSRSFEFTGAAFCPSAPISNYKLKLTVGGKDVPTEEALFEIVLAGSGTELRPVTSASGQS